MIYGHAVTEYLICVSELMDRYEEMFGSTVEPLEGRSEINNHYAEDYFIREAVRVSVYEKLGASMFPDHAVSLWGSDGP